MIILYFRGRRSTCQNIKGAYIVLKSIFGIWKSKEITYFPNTDCRKGMGCIHIKMEYDSKVEEHFRKLKIFPD